MIKIFKNGTTHWYRKELEIVDPMNPSPTESADLAQHVVWYETQGTAYLTRVNYFYNGTVAIQNVTVTTSGSGDSMTYSYAWTTIKVLVAPSSIFIGYTEANAPTTGNDADLVNGNYKVRTFSQETGYTLTTATHPTNITVASNTRTLHYAPDPTKLLDEIPGVKVGETKSLALNTGVAFFEKDGDTIRKMTFRNGSTANFVYSTSASRWNLGTWTKAPSFWYNYVWLNQSYIENVTSADGRSWSFGGSKWYTLEGYELRLANNQTTRYMP